MPELYGCIYPSCEFAGYSTKQHIKGHEGKRKMKSIKKCSFCEYKSGFSKHRRIKHPMYCEMFECLKCTSLVEIANGTRHINQHLKKELGVQILPLDVIRPLAMRCFECDFVTNCTKNLNAHILFEHYHERNIVTCKYCPFKTRVFSCWEDHSIRCYAKHRGE